MEVLKTSLPGLLLIQPTIYSDSRGHFLEVYRKDKFRELGIKDDFVQDNISHSKKGVLRGLHYQNPKAQGKLISVNHGKIFDVTVDIRRDSPTFGKWFGVELSSENRKHLF